MATIDTTIWDLNAEEKRRTTLPPEGGLGA